MILDRIDRRKPELVCLTEAHAELLQGHVVTAHEDYGIRPIRDGWRKVVLWSKEPWQAVDEVGDAAMPPGRFVAGVTRTSLGDVTVIGICIPYSHALVESRGYRAWQAHEEYLACLTRILQRASTERVIVMGDFNQRIGEGGRAPLRLQAVLRDAFPRGMTIATAAVGFEGRKTIDHIALSDDLVVESLDVVSNIRDDGGKLSDHFGVAAEVTARSS
ncbi:MAG: endonuclease/exonuclease/phosphatase family protein [Chloroflexi bacterium]|nr:endonuclease/exonuclease/phosphatase family protein [Chloroflexota bacterium]